MSQIPAIRTAIPKRRYQFGEYIVSVLGDIESADGINYRYIAAFVEEGRTRPSLYICCERRPRAESSNGAYRLRLVNDLMSEEMGASDLWKDVEAFLDEAFKIGAKALSLSDESPRRLV